jgi:DNA-binding beta-propeller fold protein YncE
MEKSVKVRDTGHLGMLGLLLAALALGGCSTPQPIEKLAWPGPPLEPRIQFVRTISGEESLGRDPSLEEKALELLTGKKPPANHIAEPMAIAVSDDGNRIYVSDFAQFAVYVFDLQNKSFLKIGNETPLQRPFGLALDKDENLYVVEQAKKSISVFNRKGEFLRSIGDESIDRPGGLAIDRERGWLYLADTSHSKSGHHDVKVFDLQGRLLRTLGGKGDADGYFLFPTYVYVDRQGHVFVTDTLNSRVQEFDADGKFLARYGQRGSGWGMFDKPKGVATDSFGNVYVVDSGWSNVQIFNRKGQVLLFFGGRGRIPGLTQNPTAIAIDTKDRIYLGDYLNHRLDVYQLVNTTAADSLPASDTLSPEGPAGKPAAAKDDKKDESAAAGSEAGAKDEERK